MATGFIQKPLNVSVSSAAWTAVTLGADQSAKDFAVQARAANNFKMSDTSAGTKYFTVKSGTAISFEDVNAPKGSTLFYAQSSAAADVLEVVITR